MADRITSPNGLHNFRISDDATIAVDGGNTIVEGVFQVAGNSTTMVPAAGDPNNPNAMAPDSIGDLHITPSTLGVVGGINPYKRNEGSHYITDYRDAYGIHIDADHSTDPGIYATNSGVVTADMYQERNAFIATHPNHIATKSYVDNRTIVSTTEPSSGSVGQQWFNPSNGTLHIYTE